MSENKKAKENQAVQPETSRPIKETWSSKHFAEIFGGTAFALLALLTLFMYVVNN